VSQLPVDRREAYVIATVASKSADASKTPQVAAKGLTIPALPRIPSRKFFRQ